LIPKCLGTIDSIKENVNFESTSSNLGRSLQLFRQDNRIGTKHLIVINKDEYETTENDEKKDNILVKKDHSHFKKLLRNVKRKPSTLSTFSSTKLDFKKTKCCLSAKKKLNNLKNF
jgi:hypothetical protein